VKTEKTNDPYGRPPWACLGKAGLGYIVSVCAGDMAGAAKYLVSSARDIYLHYV
jgi:hypothetical protein